MKKVIIGLLSGGVVLAVAIVALLVFNKGEDEYREIKIYKVEGSAEVVRGQDMVLDAFEDMQLQNEDGVNVGADSYTQLKMDEDKYALLEPDTRIKLEASGNAADSKTVITLETGTIVSHIEKPLSKNSSYEVNTSNSTMAVRGTSFRVTTYIDENGVSHTILEVIEGKVECFLVYPDGSKSEGRIFGAGSKIAIWGDGKTSDYEYDDGNVDLNELNLPVLEFLKIHFNEKYFCTEEDINKAIESKNDMNSDDEPADNTSEENNNQDNVSDTDNTDVTDDTDNTENTVNTDNTDNTDNTEDNNIAGSDDTEADDNEDNDKADNDNSPDSGQEYTVTFTYNGQVFATQTVKPGETVTEPVLRPSQSGSWDYDFDSTVDSDVTIEWLE